MKGLNNQQVKSKYNRFSLIYDLMEMPMEKLFFKRWRKELVGSLKGKVLEIGTGTGKNLPYYNYQKADLTAIELSEGMLKKARKKTQQNNYPVKLIQGDAQKLLFPSNTFDYVVCTFVLCSVPDPVQAVQEIKRVLKKKGKAFFLEHTLSKNKFIAFCQNLHNPVTVFLVGVNINRDTANTIKNSGLKIKELENLAFQDVFKKIMVVK